MFAPALRFQDSFGTLHAFIFQRYLPQLDTKFSKSGQFIRESSRHWQKILAQGFQSATDLLQFLELSPQLADSLAEKKFKTRVPLGFATRMQKGNPADPLLKQVLAINEELQDIAGYNQDPLEEKQARKQQGLLHKYQGRILLTLTGVCAINCRYCFRRHFPYADNNPGRGGWQEILQYVKQDESIGEIIFSGGDPLLASDGVLAELLTEIAHIPHVKTLRFHTRIPVVLPERINQTLLDLLAASPLKKVVVFHCNHAQELDETVQKAALKLKSVNCVLLNQSVLLAGINDSADILAALSHKLFDFGILPYYLHVLDKVAGAAHFDMPLEKALAIYQDLQGMLPGYLLPRLAREDAGKAHKTLLV